MTHVRLQRGISLIEVIVALVVISGFGAALFVWAGQTLQTASRAQEVLREVELENNITEFANSLNPAQREQGRLDLGNHVYEWSAKVLREPVDHVRHPQGISPYQVGLYTVRIKVSDRDGAKLLASADRTVAGYKQVRVRPSGPPGFSSIVTPTP